jgi:hypothetical protein
VIVPFEELREKLNNSGCNNNTQKEVLLDIIDILDSVIDIKDI